MFRGAMSSVHPAAGRQLAWCSTSIATSPHVEHGPRRSTTRGLGHVRALRLRSQAGGLRGVPLTTQLVERIPGMVMAGFSRLAPGTHITPHKGYGGWAEFVLRCHLGLTVNDGCALRVGGETRQWQAGKTLVFCDAAEHEAWNAGDTERVVLLLDFRNPAFRWKLLNPDLTPEIEQYIRNQWSDLSAKEKLHYWLWRASHGRRSA